MGPAWGEALPRGVYQGLQWELDIQWRGLRGVVPWGQGAPSLAFAWGPGEMEVSSWEHLAAVVRGYHSHMYVVLSIVCGGTYMYMVHGKLPRRHVYSEAPTQYPPKTVIL